ncbi:hypothetical protein CLI64_08630 [Nostoc sp. CENA543]|uniref:hypothetical protein n=1 Tax=Nostoc sp. CENA543 TaxID=1869241 RepID=UPI000CA0F5D4|nr:hypothetical protein [Nostoc sp. CENA543]AUT00449.1 hypothetical protein CLI64_08630 [Nostoc sp. CENA543]
MKLRFIVCCAIGVLLALSTDLPGLTQPKTDDTSAILKLVRRGYGPVDAVVIIDNYAALNYRLGQNTGKVTLKRQNGIWKIIDGNPRKFDYCAEVSCLVKKGVPAKVANQLLTRLSTAHQKQSNDLKIFQVAWAKIHGNTVTFLGYFDNLTFPEGSSVLTVSILPSYTPNKVCIVGITENSQYVEIGKVSGKTINTENEKLVLGKDLSGAYDIITSEKRNLELSAIAPPNTWYFSADTNKKLNQVGCTTSLPKNALSTNFIQSNTPAINYFSFAPRTINRNHNQPNPEPIK